MKWKLAIASLVASVAMCSQSYGFDLLDRMLGGSGCGCDVKCCETAADPSCGCNGVVDPSCGCNGAVDPSCGCNGAVVDPSCGCNAPCGAKASCCRKITISIKLPKIRPLLNRGCCKPACCEAVDPSCGCNNADPSCGCNAAADPSCGCNTAATCGCESTPACCKPACRKGLLDRIFACKKKACCEDPCCEDPGCESKCGCSGEAAPAAAPAAGETAPMPPAPMTDPAAFVSPARTYALK